MVYLYNGILLLSNKKEWIINTSNNTNESQNNMLRERSQKREYVVFDSTDITLSRKKCKLISSDSKQMSGCLGLEGQETGRREQYEGAQGNLWG